MLKNTGRGLVFDRTDEPCPPPAIVRFTPRGRLLVPLCTTKADVMELCAAPGDMLPRAGLLAVSENGDKQVFCPVSGLFEGIEKRRKPGVGLIPCAAIRPDRFQPVQEGSLPAAVTADAARIRETARRAAIVDEYDGLPLAQKLSCAPAGTPVVGDALDDQPGLFANLSVLHERGEIAAAGLRLAAAAVSTPEGACFFAAAGYFPDGYLRESYGGFPVRNLSGRYPARVRLGCAVPPLIIGVQALCALARAVAHGAVQTACAVAVGGDGVDRPQVLEVSVGTPVSELLAFLDVTGQINRLVCGGVMTGSILSPDAPVTPDLRAVTVLRTAYEPKSAPCTGCGACADVCPQNLAPLYLMQAAQNGKFDRVAKLGAGRCMRCGCCSYVCPAGIDLSAGIAALQRAPEVMRCEP